MSKVTGDLKQSIALLASFVWTTAPGWVGSRLAATRDETYRVAANFKLRTKFLLSFVVVTSLLMCLTLLVVGREARHQIDQQIEEQSSRAILMFEAMQHQHEVSLNHKAELLAALAAMRDGDPTAVASASADPWQSEDCNLFLMTDAHGKVVALQTTQGDFPIADAGRLLRQTLYHHATSAWWASGTQLYQVVVRPVTSGVQQGDKNLGAVVVGRVIDAGVASELRRISSSEVAFLSGRHIVISTFSPLDENELEKLSGTGPVPQELKIDGQKYVASSVELTEGADAAHKVTLIMLKSYSDATAFLDRLNRWLIGLLLAAVFVGAMLVLFISDTFTRPLKRLVGGVRALEQGDFEYPLEPQGGDEVAEVTRAFGRMRTTLQAEEAERRKLEDQLRRAQRMEAMGRLAGGVAHDFNNLLTVIKGHSDVLMGKLPAEGDLASSSQQIAKAADRAASLTRQLLIFSRRQATQPRVVDLNMVVSEMGKLLKRLVREDINFLFHPGEPLGHLRSDPCHLEQVIMNLVVNASDAMPSGGKLTIETYDLDVDEKMAQARPPLKSGEYVVLAVTDTGCGMDENIKAHIFEPFFTTKCEGKGTGLGLATVYGAVKQSNGFVLVESEPGNGARFEIFLPRVEEPLDLLFAPKTIVTVPARTETVLIVEDEDGVREMASEFARSAGYQVLAARDGLEALAMAQAASQPVHILLTDVVIPHIRGTQLAASLRERMPQVKIVFMSGYLESQKEDGVLPGDLFLQKPFTRDALIEKFEEALAKPKPAKNGNNRRAKLAESEMAKAVN
ncbi:MAG TPA: ATP-binding protein [Candidatus Acidoferrales bacterium]|nr:ATP-binding protein [Candidatus Acidoferrales bacterium]